MPRRSATPTILSNVEREELARLRGEVRQLRQANEILKAASVLFASKTRRELTQLVGASSARA